MNPEVAPKHWSENDEQDHCANVEWSECVYFGLIGFAAILFCAGVWFAVNLFASMVIVP